MFNVSDRGGPDWQIKVISRFNDSRFNDECGLFKKYII